MDPFSFIKRLYLLPILLPLLIFTIFLLQFQKNQVVYYILFSTHSLHTSDIPPIFMYFQLYVLNIKSQLLRNNYFKLQVVLLRYRLIIHFIFFSKEFSPQFIIPFLHIHHLQINYKFFFFIFTIMFSYFYFYLIYLFCFIYFIF